MKGSKATKNDSQNVSHSGLGLDMTTAGKGLAEEGGGPLVGSSPGFVCTPSAASACYTMHLHCRVALWLCGF